MSSNQVLLEINHLHTGFRFGDEYFNAVDDVTLTLNENEVLAIVGESGSGKSTLATSIVGYIIEIIRKSKEKFSIEGIIF